MENEKRKKRVLMTFMESGMGHIASMKSISDNLKKYYSEDFDVIESYIMQEDEDKTLKNFENFIISQTKNTNKIKGYGNFVFFIMKLIGGLRTMRFLHRTIFSKVVKHTLEAFKKRDPDIIVSTHYYMTFAALEYKKKVNKNVKVITYNPDNNIHIWWDNREHTFIVNNNKAYIEAIGKRKFNPATTKQVFFSARDEIANCNLTKEEARNLLSIPKEKFCVIIADGVYACAKAKKVTNELLKTDKPITIITVAGKNEKLLNYYEKLKRNNKIKSNIDFIVLPFKKNIYEYYKASDVFITKAGPNAILDSVFMQTPIIVDYYAHPIEKFTTKLFVDDYKMGKAIYKPRKIRKQIEEWITNPQELNRYAENTKILNKNENGGKEVARIIYEESIKEEITISKNRYENLLYELAKQGKFDTYTTPINYKNAKKEINYDKIKKKNIFSRCYKFIIKNFLKMIVPLFNFFAFRIKIKGRKNLKGIKSGITISNHVHHLDCIWIMQALKHKNLFITGAPHNLKKGFFGATLKAGGFLPIGNSLSQSKKFSEYLSDLLKKRNFVHFYPEQALWLRYEQSRPLKRGAFFYASSNNVPIIPIIICFRKTKFKKHRNVTIQICKPIYPDENLTMKENCKLLNECTQRTYDQTIIEFYNYNKKIYSMSNLPSENSEFIPEQNQSEMQPKECS